MEYKSFFKNLTGFDSYAYQRRAAVALLGRHIGIESGLFTEVNFLEEGAGERFPEEGQNVLICAPTGSGKTWATLVPFIFARQQSIPLADRVLYAVPLRSLANGLYESTRERLERLGLLSLCPVRLQTGETSAISDLGDPTFSEGRIIFCTIDQLLSSYLNIPFSLSPRQANLNGGALVGSLIVFDEFHLLDPDRSLRTALLLTRHLTGLARFIWMTATQAERARKRLLAEDRLNAIAIEVPQEEVVDIASQREKKRTWVWCKSSLKAEDIWQEHQKLPVGRKRTLVVVNTVSRAQAVYRQVRALVPPEVPVRLLHSRFLPHDRQAKTTRIRAVFDRSSRQEAILIATQVVEAGLDLSAACLHTDLAPANALVQRAGRCARFEGEEGTVFVYDTQDENGRRSYQPYERGEFQESVLSANGDSEEILTVRQAVDRTAMAVAELSNQHLSFSGELSLIDRVHTGLDLKAANSFDAQEWRRRAADVMIPRSDYSNYSVGGDLIRDIDNVSIFLADGNRLKDAAARLAPRYAPATISVPRTSLAALAKTAAERLASNTWALKAPTYQDTERGDGFSGYEMIARVGENYGKWLTATYRSGPLVLTPLLGRYTAELGLELGVPSESGDWQSTGTLTETDLNAKARPDRRYRAETFQEHIAWVRLHAELLCGDASAQAKLAHHWANRSEPDEVFQLTDHVVGLNRVDAHYGLPSGTARGLVILAAILHDAGKLTKAWQEAVWKWQELKASRRDHYPPGKGGDLRYAATQRLLERKRQGHPTFLAHTDYDHDWRWPNGRREAEIERHFSRPNHALEGAWLALPVVAQHVDLADLPAEQLAKAVLAAISQHHSPTTGLAPVNRNRLLTSVAVNPAVHDVVNALIRAKNTLLYGEQPTHDEWEDFLKMNIRFQLKSGSTQGEQLDDWAFWPLAMLCTRIVRLADQRGTRIGASK